MSPYRWIIVPAVVAAMAAPFAFRAQAANGGAAPGTTTTLDQTVALPPAYESVVSSLGAITTGGAAVLKTYRSDARALAVRAALARSVLGAAKTKQPVKTIVLDKDDTDKSLQDDALLCMPRQNYVGYSVSLSYLNALVQNINTVSTLPAAPTDIGSALALLLASSGYSIADAVGVDAATITKLQTDALTSCKKDLGSYDAIYYGAQINLPPLATPMAAADGAAAITTFAFLGPIGTLIDTFLSILQPILIDASKLVDQARRQGAIIKALTDPQIQAKITTTGEQLAAAVTSYATASKQTLAGSFVEQLVAIRETPIDLSQVADCQNIDVTKPLPSGAPNASFVACWSAAWAKLKAQVDNLTTVGDNYDHLADQTNIDAKKMLGTILADFKAINAGQNDSASLAVFAADITQFINFANAVATAVSQSNAALKSAAVSSK